MSGITAAANPFVHYRHRLDSHARALNRGLSDAAFVELVERFDREVADIEGHGFVVTPAAPAPDLAAAVGMAGPLWVKDETGSVAGSHKSRHLYGVALHLLVDQALGRPLSARLAIASCGNAALAAGVMAAALGVRLEVFVPVWADEAVVDRLESLGAVIQRCERREGEQGDPAYLRFEEAVADGAVPFSVQGTVTPTTFDGARTIGWELADQVGEAVTDGYVQVGGGALGTSVAMSMPGVRVWPVQAEGCAPLRRAWDRLSPGFDFAAAATDPERYMWPWTPEPASAASGILDDVTYDWLPLLTATHASGGEPIVAVEADIVRANQLARTHTEIPVSVTGSAGLAGLLTRPPVDAGPTAVLFTGIG